VNIATGAKTDVGRVREGNEDSYLLHEPLFVVADGMGGHLAGDVASSTAVEVIKDEADANPARDPDALAELLRRANAAIWEKAQSDASLRGMGTTCTLVMLEDEHAELAHVGDSRAYLFRNGELSQLTQDHTLVGRLVREGRLTEQEAESHPQRSIITRALGVDSDVKVDLLSLDLMEGDRLLLCSDGLTAMVDSESIAGVMADEENPQAAADKLVELANGAGGEDNITVLVLDVTEKEMAAVGAPAMPSRDEEPGYGDRIAHEESADATAARAAVAADVTPERRRRRPWVRRVIVGVVVLAVLAGAGYAAVRYMLQNSWYVGVADGRVAIYQGRPEEIAGMALGDLERTTDLAVNDLPGSTQDAVREGYKVDSLEEAQSTVANYRRLIEEQAPRDDRQRRDRPRRDRDRDKKTSQRGDAVGDAFGSAA
jgi:PPM family protein phosphatase